MNNNPNIKDHKQYNKNSKNYDTYDLDLFYPKKSTLKTPSSSPNYFENHRESATTTNSSADRHFQNYSSDPNHNFIKPQSSRNHLYETPIDVEQTTNNEIDISRNSQKSTLLNNTYQPGPHLTLENTKYYSDIKKRENALKRYPKNTLDNLTIGSEESSQSISPEKSSDSSETSEIYNQNYNESFNHSIESVSNIYNYYTYGNNPEHRFLNDIDYDSVSGDSPLLNNSYVNGSFYDRLFSSKGGTVYPVYKVHIYVPLLTEEPLRKNDLQISKISHEGEEPKMINQLDSDELGTISLALVDYPTVYKQIEHFYTKQISLPSSKLKKPLNFKKNDLDLKVPINSFIIDSSYRTTRNDLNSRLLDINSIFKNNYPVHSSKTSKYIHKWLNHESVDKAESESDGQMYLGHEETLSGMAYTSPTGNFDFLNILKGENNSADLNSTYLKQKDTPRTIPTSNKTLIPQSVKHSEHFRENMETTIEAPKNQHPCPKYITAKTYHRKSLSVDPKILGKKNMNLIQNKKGLVMNEKTSPSPSRNEEGHITKKNFAENFGYKSDIQSDSKLQKIHPKNNIPGNQMKNSSLKKSISCDRLEQPINPSKLKFQPSFSNLQAIRDRKHSNSGGVNNSKNFNINDSANVTTNRKLIHRPFQLGRERSISATTESSRNQSKDNGDRNNGVSKLPPRSKTICTPLNESSRNTSKYTSNSKPSTALTPKRNTSSSPVSKTENLYKMPRKLSFPFEQHLKYQFQPEKGSKLNPMAASHIKDVSSINDVNSFPAKKFSAPSTRSNSPFNYTTRKRSNSKALASSSPPNNRFSSAKSISSPPPISQNMYLIQNQPTSTEPIPLIDSSVHFLPKQHHFTTRPKLENQEHGFGLKDGLEISEVQMLHSTNSVEKNNGTQKKKLLDDILSTLPKFNSRK
ncbi:hypothetical protein BB558_001311 [Smittium angustum]|uniref:Uncharacterized protein n=1 Tax=Smittium angustum TaxID=133377 RepID=A0A2U1JC10_SMIAN|nr:hypothetical protein BB558_003946 [Smittium angustum]PWA02554.1 hypothetical protein BB558_001311 [Smittium angustum]